MNSTCSSFQKMIGFIYSEFSLFNMCELCSMTHEASSCRFVMD